MLINITDNMYLGTDALIEDCIAMARKLDNGVWCWDDSKDQFLEVYPESTVESVYKYYGWSE